MLIDMGIDILEISRRLGHEKIQTTLNTYSHLYPNQNRDLEDQLNKLIEDADDEEGDDNNARKA